LPARITLAELGPALGLSTRSLQRRLAASAASLSMLLDEARRDQAETLVAGGLLSLGEIAARVGFAEQASFTRAWSRWFGEPPSRAREGHGAASG
jgi:AraC-like DNA-binding protein